MDDKALYVAVFDEVVRAMRNWHSLLAGVSNPYVGHSSEGKSANACR